MVQKFGAIWDNWIELSMMKNAQLPSFMKTTPLGNLKNLNFRQITRSAKANDGSIVFEKVLTARSITEPDPSEPVPTITVGNENASENGISIEKIGEGVRWNSNNVAGEITTERENIPRDGIEILGLDLEIGMVVRDGRNIDPEAGLDLVKESRTRNEGHPDPDQRNLDIEVDPSNFIKFYTEET